VSIVHQSVAVEHALSTPLHTIHCILEDAGFDVSDPDSISSEHTLLQAARGMSSMISGRHRKHMEHCLSCQEAAAILLNDTVSPLQANTSHRYTNSVPPTDCHTLKDPEWSLSSLHKVDTDDVAHIITLSVGGMTCSSCSGTITEIVSQLPGISKVVVSLLSNSATVVVARKDLVGSVTKSIDDCGFEVDVIKIEPLVPLTSTNNGTTTGPRKLSLRVNGMYCQCVNLILVACRVTDIYESDTVQPKSWLP
jgi:Cu+-exporting ATPase